jgi:hypothetical protein
MQQQIPRVARNDMSTSLGMTARFCSGFLKTAQEPLARER